MFHNKFIPTFHKNFLQCFIRITTFWYFALHYRYRSYFQNGFQKFIKNIFFFFRYFPCINSVRYDSRWWWAVLCFLLHHSRTLYSFNILCVNTHRWINEIEVMFRKKVLLIVIWSFKLLWMVSLPAVCLDCWSIFID